MSDSAEDRLFEQLGALPAWDISEPHAEALSRLARAEFERAHAMSEPIWAIPAGLARLYHQVLEPVMVSVFCVGYFGWALRQAAAAYL